MFFYKNRKKIDFSGIKEPIILFMLFYLPGFISQNQIFDGSVFNSLQFNLIYIITIIPRILLILYLIEKKPTQKRELYGIGRLRGRDILASLLYFAGIMLIVAVAGMIFGLITSIANFDEVASPLWEFNNWSLIPLVFLTCLSIGYSEELFFRSYLLTEFHLPGKGIYAVAVTSLVFASGHIYQGFLGFPVTFVIGFFLGIMFIRKRNLHSIAIAHGLYNFTILILSGTWNQFT